MTNPLTSLFAADDAGEDHWEWPEDGPRIYVVLFTGRCGSTLLCRLMAATRACGTPDEYFNEAFVQAVVARHGPASLRQYLTLLLSKRAVQGYFGFKVVPSRLQWLEHVPGFCLDSLLRPSRVTAIWMTRHDVVAQAYSYAMAKARNSWHTDRDDALPPRRDDAPDPELDDAMVWSEVEDILSQEHWMEQVFQTHGIAPLRITYEEFVAERELTLRRVMQRIGLPASQLQHLDLPSEDPEVRMRYDARVEWLLGFHARHRDLVDLIQANRRSISPVRVAQERRSAKRV